MSSIAPTTDTTNPCPGWCDEPANHPFSVPENPLDPPDRTHRRSFGDFVRVEQWEQPGDPMEPPTIDLYDEQGSDAFWAMPADRADEIAEQLRSAARFIRQIDQPVRKPQRSAKVEAIREWSAASHPKGAGPCGANICFAGGPTLPSGRYVTCVRPAGHFGNHQRGTSD